MNLPKPAKGGNIFTWAERAWDTIRRNRVIAGPGLFARQSSDGLILSANIPPRRRYAPPFHVTLTIIALEGSSPTYEVTVHPGYVWEIIPGDGDAIAYHEPANLWDEDDPKLLATFPITVGQAVYIEVKIRADGTVGADEEEDAVVISIAEETPASIHYQPRMDTANPSGTSGKIIHKLAVLKAPEEGEPTPKLKKFLTGSHLKHLQDLPGILSAPASGDNIGIIPKEYDASSNTYYLRAIRALCGLKLEQSTNTIDIRGGGDSFRVRLWETTISYFGSCTYDSELIIDNGTAPIQEFWVLNGIWYLSEPEDWGTCGGSSEPIYDLSYVIPTTGGPA